jgi:hypothetical protein
MSLQAFYQHAYFNDRKGLAETIFDYEKTKKRLPMQNLTIFEMPLYQFGDVLFCLVKINDLFGFGIKASESWQFELFDSRNAFKLFFVKTLQSSDPDMLAYFYNEIEQMPN